MLYTLFVPAVPSLCGFLHIISVVDVIMSWQHFGWTICSG